MPRRNVIRAPGFSNECFRMTIFRRRQWLARLRSLPLRRGALVLASVLSGALLSGCGRAPVVPLFGAAFPDWLFCLIGGVILTVVVHVVLSVAGRTALLAPLPVSYVGLFAIFSVLIWLAVFAH